jgi:histone H3/H4
MDETKSQNFSTTLVTIEPYYDDESDKQGDISESFVESERDFSKNSIIKLSRKAGIKCISDCGIQKIKEILHKKISGLADDIATFYASKNCKTIEKNTILKVLESKKFIIVRNISLDNLNI